MSKWYGSVVNRLMENSKQPVPVVGMGVTECQYTDREPWEIVQVIDPKHVVVRKLDAVRSDENGMSECQDYEYKQNPENPTRHLVFRYGRWRDLIWKRLPDGTYKPGRSLGSSGWRLGSAEKYYDFSF